MADPALDDNIDAVLADYMRRSDAGETIDREAFVAAHPQVADDLREYFASVDDVERMAGPPLASTVQNGNRAAETHVTSVGDSVSEKPPRRTISADESKSDSLPETFGRYRIEKQLGRGAMGAVYLAHDTQLDRRVALKTPTFDANADADMIERFYREARAAANLRHAGICPIFDVGKIDSTHYISMAYIEGKPMSALVDVDKPLPIRSVVSLVRKIALALDHAHSQGVIHRDLKPANIMIDKQKQPLIMDFGLARRVDKHEQTRLTQDGMILGTPAYMSPEQVEGKLESGKQSDVYSLGVILYELLTGDLPFRGTVAAVIGQIMTQDAPAPSSERAKVDPALDAICQKMMARKLEDRYAGTKEAADALTSYLKGKASGRRQPAVAHAEADAPNSRTSVKTDEGLETASRDESPAGKTRRDGTLTQLFSPWNRLPARSKVIATSVLAGLLLALMGLVVMLRTPYGTLRVEVGDPNVAVKVDGQTITLKDGIGQVDKTVDKHQLTVLVGETPVPLDEETIVTIDGTRQKVRLSVSGVELTANEFAVRRNGKTTISIQLERIKAPAIGVERDGEVAGPPIPDGPPGEVLVLPHGANDVAFAALSPDGKWILTSLSLTAKEGTKTHLWSTQTGQMVDSWPGVVQGGWLPDSAAFLTYQDNVVQLRTVQRPSVASQWNTGHRDLMSPPAFTRSGDQVLIGSWDRSLTISDVRTRKLSKSLKIDVEPPSRVDSVAISVDGRTGYSYSPFADSSIRVWDLESGKLKKRIPVDKGGARGQFSSGGRRFLGYHRERIFLIDMESERVVSEWTGSEKMNRAAAISPGGRYALTIGDDYVLRLWNGETAKLLHEFKGHTDYVHTLQFSNDLRLAVSAGYDGTARVWRLPTLEPELSLAPINKSNSRGLEPQLISKFEHDGTTRRQCYLSHLSADAGRVAFRMQWKASMQMFETTSRKAVPLPELLQTATTIDDNADGSLLAAGHTDGTVRLWNSRTLKPVGQPFVTTSGFFVRWISLSDDGKTLLALPSGQPPTFYAWDIESREPITEPFVLGDDNKVKGVYAAASADNLLLAVAYYEKDEDSQHFVELWDVRTGKPRSTRFEPNPGSQGTIYGIDLSPSGDRLAVGGKHGNCFVFDTATGKQTMNALHGGRVFSVRFSPDGRQLATCGGPADSEDMHLWDLETGEELVRWSLPTNSTSRRTDQFGAMTSFLVYSRDGSRLLTSGLNTPVCVWNLEGDHGSGSLIWKDLTSFPAATDGFSAGMVTSSIFVNGKHLGGDGTVKDLHPRAQQQLPKTGKWIFADSFTTPNPKAPKLPSEVLYRFRRPVYGLRMTIRCTNPETTAQGRLQVYADRALVEERDIMTTATSFETRFQSATQLSIQARGVTRRGGQWILYTNPQVLVTDDKPTATQGPALAKAPFKASQAKAHQQAWADYLNLPIEKEVDLPGGAKINFMLIPPGEFLMGSTDAVRARFHESAGLAQDPNFMRANIPSEGPPHRVVISEPFYFGKFELTQDQFEAVMGRSSAASDRGEYPMVNVSRTEIQAMIDKLNQTTQPIGMTIRFPTEAEWEYACRAGTDSAWHFADTETDFADYAWTKVNSSRRTHPVGQLKPNPWGLYDLYGNVWEWCADLFGADYYSNSPVHDPTGPTSGGDGVIRGGGCHHLPMFCRSAWRGSNRTTYEHMDVGIRLAASINTTEFGASRGDAVPTTRKRWVHSRSEFAEIIPRVWRETTSTDGRNYFYEEIARTEEYIEIKANWLDRFTTYRLFDNHIEGTSSKSDGEFTKVFTGGKWDTTPVSSTTDLPPVDASDQRKAWSHSGGGRFDEIARGVWRETGSDGRKFFYEEVARTSDYVEMLGRGGNQSVRYRLYGDHGDRKHSSNQTFTKFFTDGKWEGVSGVVEESEWTDLFNGKDLTGWRQMKTSGRQHDVHRPTTGDWVVQNGQILCNSSDSGWLKSVREFDNFELQLEFRLSQLGNSGVYIRSRGSGRLSRTGIEAQVIDDTAAKFNLTSKIRSGAIHNVIGPSTSALKPIGEWNTMSIRCEGDLIQVMLNGVVTAERNMADDSALRSRPRSGYLGLSNWNGEGNGTAFRNIRIRELEKPTVPSGPSTPKPQTKIEQQLKKLEEAIFPWLVWVQAEGDKRKPLAVATARGLCCVYPGGFKSVEISSLDETQKAAGTVGSRSPFPFCWIDPATPKATGIPLARAGAHRIAQPGLIVMRVNGKPELQLGQINADGTFTPEKPYNPPNRGVAAPGPIFNANGECLGYGVRSKRGSPIKIYPLRRD